MWHNLTPQQQFEVVTVLGSIVLMFGPVLIFQAFWSGRRDK